MNGRLLGLLVGTTALAAMPAFAQDAPENAAGAAEAQASACQDLIDRVQNQGENAPIDVDRARELYAAGDQQACEESLAKLDNEAGSQSNAAASAESDNPNPPAAQDGQEDPAGTAVSQSGPSAEPSAQTQQQDAETAPGGEAAGSGEDTTAATQTQNDDGETAGARVAVTDLEGQTVVDPDGAALGEVDNVIVQDNQVMAVIGHGGFLGIGGSEAAVPVKDLRMEGENVILNRSEDELSAMPEWDSGQAYDELGDSAVVEIGS